MKCSEMRMCTPLPVSHGVAAIINRRVIWSRSGKMSCPFLILIDKCHARRLTGCWEDVLVFMIGLAESEPDSIVDPAGTRSAAQLGYS